MLAIHLRLGAFSAALALLAATSSGALAQKKYDTGASDTEIKIGNIMPYSGPAPVSYFFCASAPLLVAASNARAAEKAPKRKSMASIV